MSRASVDPATGITTAAPSLGRAIREAAVDFYYNSWRLVPANVAWAAVGLVILAVGGPGLVGLGLVPFLALPTVGLFAMAARLARGEPTSLNDFGAGIRASWRPALLVAAGSVAAALVCTTNLLTGLGSNEPLGWFVAASAFWGDVGLALGLPAIWSILGDPRRREVALGRRLRLAALVVLVRPRLVAVLGLFAVVLLVVSTILFAALVTVSIAYLALVAARIVLPIADGLEPPSEVAPVEG